MEGGESINSETETMEEVNFEIAVVLKVDEQLNESPAKSDDVRPENDESLDEISKPPLVFTDALEKLFQENGLKTEVVKSKNGTHFIKVGCSESGLIPVAENLKIKKQTILGIDSILTSSKLDVFVKQPSGQLLSWKERYTCLEHVIRSSSTSNPIVIQIPEKKHFFQISSKVSLFSLLESMSLIKDVFPLHVKKEKKLLSKKWTFNFTSFTKQPLDDIYSYFGSKVAIYFAFLGMYTNWLFSIALIGLIFQICEFNGFFNESMPLLLGTIIVIWSILFLQFWKRKNVELNEKWEIINTNQNEIKINQSQSQSQSSDSHSPFLKHKMFSTNRSTHHPPPSPSSSSLSLSPSPSPSPSSPSPLFMDRNLKKEEWSINLHHFQNMSIALLSILSIHLPVELIFQFLLSSFSSQPILMNALFISYILSINQLTKLGSYIGMKINKKEKFSNAEEEENSLIFKLFGFYFVQTYMGMMYAAIINNDFYKLRSFIFKRLVFSQLLNNITENLIPFLSYRYKKYKQMKKVKKMKKTDDEKDEEQDKGKEKEKEKEKKGRKEEKMSDVEKQYLLPSYESIVGKGKHDGTFNDFLELALQFGFVTMFASSFPLIALFSLINNIIEIRSDSFKLIHIFRRPRPLQASSMGAWFSICQQLGVVSIVTNCILILFMNKSKVNANIDLNPLVLTLIFLEHFLFLIRFSLKWFIPEVPAWVQVKRAQRNEFRSLFFSDMLDKLDIDTSSDAIEQ